MEQAHHIVAKLLEWISMAGGKGSVILMSKGFNSVRETIIRDVMQTDDKTIKAIPEKCNKSILLFAQHCLKNSSSEVEDVANALTLLCAIFASDDFEMHTTLGEAFGAAATSKGPRTKGGHAYVMCTFCGMSAILEGTASVLDRMQAEHADHVKSVMRFEKGLSILMTDRLCTNDSKMNVKPMMVSSGIEHTDDFYGKALVTSCAQTFVDATAEDQKPHGAYLFTKDDTVGGKLVFGMNPESPLAPNAVFAQVAGTVVDKTIKNSVIFQKLVTGSDVTAPISKDQPFTDSVKSGIVSVRELCGQRIPYNQWKVWMDRMWGENPDFGNDATSPPGEKSLFNAAGRVARYGP